VSTSTGSGPAGVRAMPCLQHDVQQGYRTVIDVDLSKFFDRVNHDILIDRLRQRVTDARVIGLVRVYLNAGTHGWRHGGRAR
jgi:RNA-directed DNA polymerase